MKRFISTIVLTCLLTGLSQSQITITDTDMPVAGDTVRVSFAQDPVDPVPTGTNYNWNFSTLTPTAQDLQQFDAPADFTFPFNFIFNTSNTSHGVRAFVPLDLGFLQTSDTYNYFHNSSSAYQIVGIGLSINSIPIPVEYAEADIYYLFPLNYGNLDSADAFFGMNIPGIGYYGQSIRRVNEVDGWGSVTTPFGTEDCIRLKSTLHIRDTISLDTMGGGFATDRPTSYEYKWLTQNGKVPYLQINVSDVGGNPTVTNIIYQDVYQSGTIQIGIEDESQMMLSVYPNPASELLNISYTLAKTDELSIKLINIQGQVVYTKNLGAQGVGEYNQQVNLKQLNLSSGVYLLTLTGINHQNSQRLIIQ